MQQNWVSSSYKNDITVNTEIYPAPPLMLNCLITINASRAGSCFSYPNKPTNQTLSIYHLLFLYYLLFMYFLFCMFTVPWLLIDWSKLEVGLEKSIC